MRNSTVCPTATRGMSSSLTSATTCSGFGTPTRNRIWPTSAISPISPSRRSTTPSIGATIDVVVDLLDLHRDQRLDLLAGPSRRARTPAWSRRRAPISSLTRVISRLRNSSRALQFLQLRLHLAVVEARQHVAFGDRLALAVADLDDAVADEARHLGPAHRLDRAGGVDDLDRGAALRRRPLSPPARARSATSRRPAPAAARRPRRSAVFAVSWRYYIRARWPDIDVAASRYTISRASARLADLCRDAAFADPEPEDRGRPTPPL